MKRLFILMFFLAFAASAAFAEPRPGQVTIFPDPSFAYCDLYDVWPGLLTMYIVHWNAEEVGSSRWKLEVPTCNRSILLGQINGFELTIGNPFTGVEVIYGACLSVRHILIMTINWFGDGTTPPCCEFRIVPDPAAPSGDIEVTDCNLSRMRGNGGGIVINPTEACSCRYWHSVHETTWGRVKALYR